MANAGRYRTRMTINPMKIERDDSGGPVLGKMKKPKELWCSVRPLSARDRFEAEIANSEVTFEVKTRHRTDIDAHTKLEQVGGTLKLEVVGLYDPAMRHDELVLLCAERT